MLCPTEQCGTKHAVTRTSLISVPGKTASYLQPGRMPCPTLRLQPGPMSDLDRWRLCTHCPGSQDSPGDLKEHTPQLSEPASQHCNPDLIRQISLPGLPSFTTLPAFLGRTYDCGTLWGTACLQAWQGIGDKILKINPYDK